MARWKLLTAHYMHLEDPTEWEYQETGRDGKPRRQKMKVPRLLDPRDPSDWNNVWGPSGAQDGEIIVCTPGTGNARDYAFLGDPTPDMMPLDDAAKAHSAQFTTRWAYKPDGEVSYSQSLIDQFQAAQAETAAKPQQVEIAGMDRLLETMATLIASQAQAAPAPVRRA